MKTKRPPAEPSDWERDWSRAGMKTHAGCGGDIVPIGNYLPPPLPSVKYSRCGVRWSRRDARSRFRREGETA